jgi:hypothetical protein
MTDTKLRGGLISDSFIEVIHQNSVKPAVININILGIGGIFRTETNWNLAISNIDREKMVRILI